MRILILGAGAIGGYFGGRLLQAGRDVTFLVRPKRAAQLAETGLVIRSRFGDATVPHPPTVLADTLRGPFDLVIVSAKAYDLESAIRDVAPAVGPKTAILPLLNGLRHIDVLEAHFGAGPVLGGQCLIAVTLDEAGRILHLNENQSITFGERAGGRSARIDAIAAALGGATFDARVSESILLDMWEKWVFLATLAGATCLMRAPVGDIVSAGGAAFGEQLLAECAAIAAGAGYRPRPALIDNARQTVTAPGSPLTASMLRDVERGARTEADHVIGDLLARAGSTDPRLLRLVALNLRAYDARRSRTA